MASCFQPYKDCAKIFNLPRFLGALPFLHQLNHQSICFEISERWEETDPIYARTGGSAMGVSEFMTLLLIVW